MENEYKDPYIHGENTPVSNFLEELLSRINLDLSEIADFLQSFNAYNKLSPEERKRFKEPTKINKSDLLLSLVKDIRQLSKEYNITQNKKIWEDVYKNIYEPILSLNKDNKLVEIEKVLHDVAAFGKNIFRSDIEKDIQVDDEGHGYDLLYGLFREIPIPDFDILYGIYKGEQKIKNFVGAKEKYVKNIKNKMEKDLNRPLEVYDDEVQEAIPQALHDDFNELWEKDFKYKWAEIVDKQSDAFRKSHSVQTLEEKIRLQIREEFLKG